MSTTITGTDTYPTSLTIPSDGDARTAASVNTPLGGLADRTYYLHYRVIDGIESGVNMLTPNLAGGTVTSTPLAARDGGHFASMPAQTPTNADHSLYILDGDVIFTPIISANRAWTMFTAGAIVGSRWRIYDGHTEDIHIVLLQPDGSTPICSLQTAGTGVSGRYQWVELYCNDPFSSTAAWKICGGQKMP